MTAATEVEAVRRSRRPAPPGYAFRPKFTAVFARFEIACGPMTLILQPAHSGLLP